MLTIYTNPHISNEVESIIKSVEGLAQHIQLSSLAESGATSNFYLTIDKDIIYWPINWDGTEPPILFPNEKFTTDSLLALIMTKLGHFELIKQFKINSSLQNKINQYQFLISGSTNYDVFEYEDDFKSIHNAAITRQYSGNTENGINLDELYEKGINKAPTVELKAFTSRQYALYLVDSYKLDKAETILKTLSQQALSQTAFHAVQFDLVNLLMKKVGIPYDFQLINLLKDMITKSIQFYEEVCNDINVAMLLTHASEIANVHQSYSESLGYINRAIEIYENEQIPEFLATAFLRKGTLLYTWAQSGNPQFYKTALETYQHALKIFKKEVTPDIFAEIHHNLGVIYAEIPADEKQKQIWSAISASSFKESLSFYTKEHFPYEHAMVLNNYANALMKYPPSKHGDNFEKAITCFFEVLEIRTAKAYPRERAYTLINFLEACWRVNNVNSTMERVRLKDMLQKANEIKNLIDDPEIIKQAEEHIKRLQELNLMEVHNA